MPPPSGLSARASPGRLAGKKPTLSNTAPTKPVAATRSATAEAVSVASQRPQPVQDGFDKLKPSVAVVEAASVTSQRPPSVQQGFDKLKPSVAVVEKVPATVSAEADAKTSDADVDDESPYAFRAVEDALPTEEEFGGVRKASKKYKIAMFAWESLHSIAVGGVAPHLTELAAGLERRGHEVHVYVRTGEGQVPYERVDGVHIHRIAFELSSDFVQEVTNMCNAMVHFMLETERFMNKPFDICHAHDWLAAPALLNIKRNHDRRCVLTVHSTEYGRCGNNVYGGQSAAIRGIEADAVALADKVIGVSGVLCDEIKDHYSFDWDKLRCVYNGINCLRYDGNLWDPAEVRAKYGVGPMDPMVLFVGRMATQKGPDILVEAIPSVLASRPEAKFILVGDGYMKDGLIARVHEMGVQGSVCFTGTMSGQPLVDLFKATDLVAIPSRNEPFGIVTLEAWASNKPVVVTKSGGPREFVWHDHDGYLVDTSSDGLAWGIGTAFANFEHARYMGERGRVKAAFQFSWDNIAENTNNIYDELLPDHPGHLAEGEEEMEALDVKNEIVEKVGGADDSGIAV